MSCLTERSILPQVAGRTWRVVPLLASAAFLGLALGGCVSVNLQASKPVKPVTLEQAHLYLSSKSTLVERLNYELNQKERSCYERFMVSDCVDSVRAARADYRRAHIEAEAAANDLIRLERYRSRKAR